MAKLTFLLLITVLLNGQSTFRDLAKKAWQEYGSKNFIASAKNYEKALKAIKPNEAKPNVLMNLRYNAACAWSLSKNPENALDHLEVLSNTFTNVKQISNDTDFKSLYNNPRWKKIIKRIETNYERIKPLSKKDLKTVFEEYIKAEQYAYRAGSKVSDVDRLYSFYTEDFIYNHPGYGDEYTRDHLYNNTVKFLKAGRYKDSKKRDIVKMIIGLNAIAVERRYEGRDKTTMTLFKFRKNKIEYIHEYW